MTLDTDALLPWADTDGGFPWGVGSHMARRKAAGMEPWVTGCSVQVLIGGYSVMGVIRDQMEAMITAALASPHPPGERGFVYLTDWRMNGQRDLSEANTWGTGSWKATQTAVKDQTAMGLLMRLIHAGIRVRALLWMPVGNEYHASGMAHIHDHVWIASVVSAANRSALAAFAAAGVQVSGGNLGVVGLDARVVESNGTHHQKSVVVRGGPDMARADGKPIAVAFVGGVDLAFTRRDAPGVRTKSSGVQFLDGDWQSGTTIPAPGSKPPWPQGPVGDLDYSALSGIGRLDKTQDSDLYADVYGDSATADRQQIWHDQHLVIRGPAVEIIEGQFVDRWMDAGTFQALPGDGKDLSKGSKLSFGAVTLSSTDEILDTTNPTTLQPLPEPQAADPVPGGAATVQLWRTIPVRNRSTGSAYADHHALFTGGEFTVLAGFARAASHAQHLIWIFDQYFWSLPYARLLNQLVTDPSKPDLNIIVILPVHSDSPPSVTSLYSSSAQHRARREALTILVGASANPRVSVWDLWDRRPWRTQTGHGAGLGIYVHAKAHTYDGSLLVCGSANINKRSLTGDSEIACAVLDPPTVAQHLRDRWQLLFPGEPWPKDSSGRDLDLDGPAASGVSPGALFHAAFKAAAAKPTSFLTPDQWTRVMATLPNGVRRDGKLNDFQYNKLLNLALESTSLPANIEAPVSKPSGTTAPATLADIADRIARRGAAGQGGRK